MPMPIPRNSDRHFTHRGSGKKLAFGPWPLGINRSSSDKQLKAEELVECLNLKYNDDGNLVTRNGLTRVTEGGTDDNAAITFVSNGIVEQRGALFDRYYFDDVTFAGPDAAMLHRIVVADENHKIYYLDAGNILAPIASNYTAEGAVFIVPFAGYCIIFDGSYLKYWDGNVFKMAYDDGSGTDGYQADDTGDDQDSTTSLYSGSTTRTGRAYTSQEWTSGWTIPVTRVQAVLSKSGSPTGSIVAKIYNAGRTAALATSGAVSAATLGATAAVIDFEFDLDNTLNQAPSTEYFVAIEYSGGDSSNYVVVHKCDDATTEYIYTSSWGAGTGTPLYAVQPGRPPKGGFGCVRTNRLFFVDPDNPGLVRYSNANTIFDYSTSNGGGYIGVVDENANNFPIGGIIAHYGDLYIIGRNETPYITKVTGSTPDSFAQELLMQKISTVNNTIASTINDVWFTSETGVMSMSGVELYGDIRVASPGDPINPTVQDYFSSSAFASYNPIDGQYWLKMAGYDRVLVAHTKRPVVRSDGKVRYPWTEYLFNGITPTAFGFSQDTFYVGAADGHLYSLTGDVNDHGAQPDYELKTGITEYPLTKTIVSRVAVGADSDAAATFNMKFYRDGETSPLLTSAQSISSTPIREKVLFSFRSLQIELDTLVITQPFNLQGFNMFGRLQEI